MLPFSPVFSDFQRIHTGTIRFVKEHAATDIDDVRSRVLFVHTKKTRELKKYVAVGRSSWQATARHVWNDMSGESRVYKVFGTQILRRNFASRTMESWHRGKICKDMSAAQFETELSRIMNTSTEILKNNYLCTHSTAELDHAHEVRKAMRLSGKCNAKRDRESIDDEEEEVEGESLFEVEREKGEEEESDLLSSIDIAEE